MVNEYSEQEFLQLFKEKNDLIINKISVYSDLNQDFPKEYYSEIFECLELLIDAAHRAKMYEIENFLQVLRKDILKLKYIDIPCESGLFICLMQAFACLQEIWSFSVNNHYLDIKGMSKRMSKLFKRESKEIM